MKLPRTTKPSSGRPFSGDIYPEDPVHVAIVEENKRKALNKLSLPSQTVSAGSSCDCCICNQCSCCKGFPKGKVCDDELCKCTYQGRECKDVYCVCNTGCHADCPCTQPSQIGHERDGAVWVVNCREVWHLSHYE